MQINLIVDLVLASLIGVGAISWLYYADRIVQLPLGVIGIALGTALLPRLSAQFRADDLAPVRQTLADAVTFASFFVLPASVALAMIGPDIITGLFRYGAFSMADAQASGLAVAAYAIGLPGHLLVKILQPAFYANHRPGLVLAVSVAMVTANIILSLSLMPHFGHVGLALATSISGILAAVALMVAAMRAGYVGALPGAILMRICAACGAMVAMLAGLDLLLPPVGAALRMAVLVGGGGTAFLITAILVRAVPRQLIRG
jgi:putative peptidoglycan lipid II flippase